MNSHYVREDSPMTTEHRPWIVRWFWLLYLSGIALLAIGSLVLVVSKAHAQSVTISATPTTAVSKATPVVTFDVTGAGARAYTCTASGGWSGAQVPGSYTQAEITQTTTYSVTCSAPAIAQETTARLVWELPTANTDGSAYTNAKGFLVYGAQTQAGLATATARSVTNPTATSVTYTGIGQPGTWWFCVKAVNALDLVSECSNVASKTIAPGVPAWSETKSVTVTITAPPVPNPPANLTVTDVIAYRDDGNGIGTRVAMTPLRSSCDDGECTVVARIEQ